MPVLQVTTHKLAWWMSDLTLCRLLVALCRVNSARYVASCPAVDQPAWLHTDPGHWAPYTARPVLDNVRFTPSSVLATR